MDANRLVGHYEIIKHMQCVDEANYYEAFDTITQTSVTLRTLDLNQMGRVGAGMEHLAKDKLRRKMDNEKRLMDRLKHPGLLQILEDGLDQSLYYQAYPLFTFYNLDMHIKQHGPMPLNDALTVMRGVADTLVWLHQSGIIHCGLSTDTILLLDGQPKIIAFSIANHDAPEGVAPGNPRFMSPETITGAKPHVSNDIWAMGAILYYILTGELPFGDVQEPRQASVPVLFGKILHEIPNFESAPLPDLPPQLTALLHGLLEKDPAKRIQSMEQVKADIEALL